LYVSNAALKMDIKLECDVDVEGTVDMMVRGGGTKGAIGYVAARARPAVVTVQPTCSPLYEGALMCTQLVRVQNAIYLCHY
jgi:hypothetical protein